MPRLPPVAGQRQPLGHRRWRPILARALAAAPSAACTYRFLFAPGTIGAITWLARQRGASSTASAPAWSLACVGDRRADRLQAQPAGRRRRSTARRPTSSRTRRNGESRSSTSRPTATTSGSSARRASTCRSAPHPSGHDRSAAPPHLGRRPRLRSTPTALGRLAGACARHPGDRSRRTHVLASRSPKGEPQLGRRGLYRAFGGRADASDARAGTALGAEPGRRAAHDCSTSPSAPGCPSHVVARRRARSRAADLLRREHRAVDEERGRMKVVLFCGGLGTRLRSTPTRSPSPW